MRTRIALVAITSIASITVTLLTQAVTMQPARASIVPPHPPASSVTRPTDRLTSFVTTKVPANMLTTTITPLPNLTLGAALLSGHLVGIKETEPVVLPPPVIVDTVTPAQRAAWNRVAICEEGGNWQADGPRFSGGLGISRANWAIYGGLQYASEGAMAQPDQQIMVAERIQSTAPDQYGCRSW